MKDDEYKGYYCLLIAILCDLNQQEKIKRFRADVLV